MDDGNKILVSYGSVDMRVIRLGFLSIVKGVIHIFNTEFLYNLNSKIGYDLSKDVVKILSDELEQARTLEEVKNICLDMERDEDFLKKI